MLNAYERRLIAFYLANAASSLRHRDHEASELAEWMTARENRVAWSKRKRLHRRNIDPDEGMSDRKWRSLQDTLRDEFSAAKKGAVRPDRAPASSARPGDGTPPDGGRESWSSCFVTGPSRSSNR